MATTNIDLGGKGRGEEPPLTPLSSTQPTPPENKYIAMPTIGPMGSKLQYLLIIYAAVSWT